MPVMFGASGGVASRLRVAERDVVPPALVASHEEVDVPSTTRLTCSQPVRAATRRPVVCRSPGRRDVAGPPSVLAGRLLAGHSVDATSGEAGVEGLGDDRVGANEAVAAVRIGEPFRRQSYVLAGLVMSAGTSASDIVGFAEIASAATPAALGVAALVP